MIFDRIVFGTDNGNTPICDVKRKRKAMILLFFCFLLLRADAVRSDGDGWDIPHARFGDGMELGDLSCVRFLASLSRPLCALPGKFLVRFE